MLKNRRLRNYLLFPKIQLKYAFIFTSIVAVCLVCVFALQNSQVQQLCSVKCDEVALLNYFQTIYKYQASLLIIASAFTFLVTILVTHRFLGPTVAIKRSLEEFRKKRRFSAIIIRKNDEVTTLVDDLNKFMSELESQPSEDLK